MAAKILFLLSVIYTIAITWFSLMKMNFKVSLGGFDPTDKMLHAGAYLVLVMVWKLFFLFKSSNFNTYKSTLWWVALSCFIFGTLIEVLQGTLTSYRDPDWYDVIANSTGVLLAVILFIVWAPMVKRLKQKITL